MTRRSKRQERGLGGPQKPSDPTVFYKMRLFITGHTPRSIRSVDNLQRICADRLAGKVDLEIIDIYQQPELAKQAHIIATPTLVKMLPRPMRKLVGDFSLQELVLLGLNPDISAQWGV